MVRDGLVVGSGGNLSARLPPGDRILVTAAGTDLAELGGGDFSLVDLGGRHVGGQPRPSSETSTHLAAYRARSDIGAVVHAHPPYATLLDALGRPIRLLTTDHAFYVGRIARTPYHHPGGAEVAAAVDEGVRAADVVLLAHHGCVVVAASPDLAYRRAVNLEEAAKATYRALLLGDTSSGPPAEMADWVAARRMQGTEGV